MRGDIQLQEYLPDDRQKLLKLARSRNTAQKVVLRAWIILKAMEGKAKHRIANELGTSRSTVYLWMRRYREGGVPTLLKDAPRSGRIPSITEEKEKEQL